VVRVVNLEHLRFDILIDGSSATETDIRRRISEVHLRRAREGSALVDGLENLSAQWIPQDALSEEAVQWSMVHVRWMGQGGLALSDGLLRFVVMARADLIWVHANKKEWLKGWQDDECPRPDCQVRESLRHALLECSPARERWESCRKLLARVVGRQLSVEHPHCPDSISQCPPRIGPEGAVWQVGPRPACLRLVTLSANKVISLICFSTPWDGPLISGGPRWDDQEFGRSRDALAPLVKSLQRAGWVPVVDCVVIGIRGTIPQLTLDCIQRWGVEARSILFPALRAIYMTGFGIIRACHAAAGSAK
jgi:hypothetical protein